MIVSHIGLQRCLSQEVVTDPVQESELESEPESEQG